MVSLSFFFTGKQSQTRNEQGYKWQQHFTIIVTRGQNQNKETRDKGNVPVPTNRSIQSTDRFTSKSSSFINHSFIECCGFQLLFEQGNVKAVMCHNIITAPETASGLAPKPRGLVPLVLQQQQVFDIFCTSSGFWTKVIFICVFGWSCMNFF